jgi:hypothetical protein
MEIKYQLTRKTELWELWDESNFSWPTETYLQMVLRFKYNHATHTDYLRLLVQDNLFSFHDFPTPTWMQQRTFSVHLNWTAYLTDNNWERRFVSCVGKKTLLFSFHEWTQCINHTWCFDCCFDVYLCYCDCNNEFRAIIQTVWFGQVKHGFLRKLFLWFTRGMHYVQMAWSGQDQEHNLSKKIHHE